MNLAFIVRDKKKSLWKAHRKQHKFFYISIINFWHFQIFMQLDETNID